MASCWKVNHLIQEEETMSEAFIGEIRMFGGTFAPMDWAFCNGQLLPINQYDALFALVGTTYGGDGTTNFALPDLRGRLPVHQGNGHTIGQMAGAETVTLAANQIPAHTHAVLAKAAAGDQNSPANTVWAAAPSARYSANPPSLAMKSSLVGNAGSVQPQPHDNIMPFLAVNFIIALAGIFPTRD
jgi:microcystin-dependent protein